MIVLLVRAAVVAVDILLCLRAVTAAPSIAAQQQAGVATKQPRKMDLPYPPLETIENVLLTTAKADFQGFQQAYDDAVRWYSVKTTKSHRDKPLPHLACTGNLRTATGQQQQGGAHGALLHLRANLPSESHARVVFNSEKNGACFVLTASPDEASAIVEEDAGGRLLAFMGPFPSILKFAPGLLEYQQRPVSIGGHDDKGGGVSTRAAAVNDHANEDDGRCQGSDKRHDRLTTTHGRRLRHGDVRGLSVELSPGLLPATAAASAASAAFASPAPAAVKGTATSYFRSLVSKWLVDLMSPSLNLHTTSFWSDPGMLNGVNGHLTRSGGELRAREWTRAADVVKNFSVVHRARAGEEGSGGGRAAPGDVCGWDAVAIHHTGNDLLVVAGSCMHLSPMSSEKLHATAVFGLAESDFVNSLYCTCNRQQDTS